MLSLEETSNVVVILQSEKQNLQHIQDQFQKSFKFETYPRLSLSLRCMLDGNYYGNTNAESTYRGDGVSNYQSEVLITYFLLHLMASAPPHKKEDDTLVHIPNTRSVLYEQLQKLETYIREKRNQASKDKDKKKEKESTDEEEIVRVKTVLKFFILQCVTGKMKGPALTQTPLEVLKADMKLLETEYDKLGKDQQILRDKLKELQSSYDDERKNSFGGFLGKGISPIVVVPDESSDSSEAISYGPTISNSDLNPLRFEPVFDRPRPPALPLGDNELTFLYTEGYFSDLMVDFSLSSTQSLEVRELILKAYKSRLTPEQSNQVLTLLKSDDAVLYRLGLSPTVERLQPLVENNPSVAEHCFARLLGTPYAYDFLTALISLPLSLASMEIVNKLTVHPLPKDIIHTYISNIIASTRSTVDKGIQTRHARLVCVFIQSLIRTKILTEHELFAETRIGVDTQEFCVEFVKVKESNQLYRLLRQMDPNSGGITDEQPSGSPLGNGTPIEPGPEK